MKKKKPKVKDMTKTQKAHAAISDRKPNDFGRSGNDADRELEALRGMDKEHRGNQKKKK